MSRLIESIRVLDGSFSNLAFHQARMHHACVEVLGMKNPWDLTLALSNASVPSSGLVKCRVVYDDINISISFAPYEPRLVNSLKIIHDDSIDYNHKYADRTQLQQHFQSRGSCDDILIIKNGLVTDTSNANIVFISNGEWVTPANCLLKGTMRQYLIATGRLRVSEIRLESIPEFESFKLINAMIMDQAPFVSTDLIFP